MKKEQAKQLIGIYCQEGDLDSLKQVVIKYSQLIDEPDNSDSTPLVISIKNEHYDLANFLLLQGADIDYTNRLNQSALFWAAANNNLEAAFFLLEAGANINLIDRVSLDVNIEWMDSVNFSCN